MQQKSTRIEARKGEKKMGILEKIALVIYSFIILAIAGISSLLVLGWLSPVLVGEVIMRVINGEKASIVLLTVNAIFVLLSIKCIFFRKKDKKARPEEQGILLQNENGKLIISKDTIENLVNTIITQFESVEGATNSITLNEENNLIINLNLTVGENIIIKELSANVQEKIKTALKTALDLEVKEVNIKIKDYANKKENTAQQ